MKVHRCDLDKPCVQYCNSNESPLCGTLIKDEKLKEKKEAHKASRKKYYEENKEAYKAYNKKWYEENKEAKLEKGRYRIQRNRDALKEYLGGKFKCKHCGFEYPTSAPFDFHHIDPNDKEGNIGRLIQGSLEKLLREAAKCIFLCKTCHAIEHERLKDEH